MQAILKGKHQRFCNWLLHIKSRLIPDDKLDELEQEMYVAYEVYLQKREELRAMVNEYEEKQKLIKMRVKRNIKYSVM